MTERKLENILKDILDRNPEKFVEIIENQYKNYRQKYGDNLSDYDRLQSQILFDGRNIKDYTISLESVDEWIDKCIDDIRNNLHVISYPLYVHLYLSMIQKNFWSEAYVFLEKHKNKYLAFNDEIVNLSLLKDPLNKSDPLVSNYLTNKIHIYIPKTIFEFFIHFLNTNNLILVLDIINKYFERSNLTSKISSLVEENFKFALLNHSGEEIERINSRTAIYCNKIKKDMDIQIKGKSRKGEKMTLSKVIIPIPETYLENIPLETNNIKIDKINLPTIGCFTILNTQNRMNCSDLTNDGSIIAIGLKDGIVLVWILDNDIKLEINDETLKSLKEFRELNFAKIIKNKEDRLFELQKLEKTSDLKIKIPHEEESGAYEEIIKNHRLIKFEGHTGSIYGVSISPDKKYLISGSYDETIRLWSFFTKSTLVVFKGHFAPVLCVKFSPFSHYFASGGSDRTAKLWSVNHPGPMRLFVGHLSDVEIVDFHPNSLYLVTSSNDKTIRLWTLENGACVRIFFNTFKSYIDCLNFSNSGKILVVGCDKSVILYDLVKMGDPIKIIENFTSTSIHSLVFDNEDNILTVSTEDYKIFFFDFNSMLNDDLSIRIDSINGKNYKFELIVHYLTKKTAILNMKYTQNNLLLTLGRFDDNNPKIFM